jgi:hypothetical protein
MRGNRPRLYSDYFWISALKSKKVKAAAMRMDVELETFPIPVSPDCEPARSWLGRIRKADGLPHFGRK